MSAPRELSISNRIDAVVAATRIYDVMREDANFFGLPFGEPWMIIGSLREGDGSLTLIRKWLDVILEAELAQFWRTCWVRRHVGQLELALGLEVDPRSAEALAAHKAGDAAWKSYTSSRKSATAASMEACQMGDDR
jgi:hypothetical protein